MFTTIKIKRICKKFKAPDVEIPVLTAAPKRRVNIKFAYATAALALVILGASVLGIKGNIFGHTPPLTPDVPATPDTPTPPDDDVKIIYADSETVNFEESMGSLNDETLRIHYTLREVINSKENEGCKFAVYVSVIGIDYDEIVCKYDEKYRFAYNVYEKFCEVLNTFDNIVIDGRRLKHGWYNPKYEASERESFKEDVDKFPKCAQELVSAMKEYEEKYDDELYFNEQELEEIYKMISLTKEELLNADITEAIYSECSDIRRSIPDGEKFWEKLDEYRTEFDHIITDEIIKEFASHGIKLETLSEKAAQFYKGAQLELYEATLTKEEIYSLEGTKYGVRVFGRAKNPMHIFWDANL